MLEIAYVLPQFFMGNAWLILCLTIVSLTLWLAWQNRASTKVKSAIIGGLAAGITGYLITIPALGIPLLPRLVLVAGGTFSAIWIHLKEENKKLEFPAASIYEKSSRNPLEELNETYRDRFTCRTLACPGIFITSRMSADDGTDFDAREEFYSDVLFRLVVDQLHQSFCNIWDLKAVRSHLPYGILKWEPNEGALPGDFIDRSEFIKLFSDSRALEVERFGLVGDRMSVPKGTRLEGGPEKFGGSSRTCRRWFTLENNFVKVRVDLSWSGGGIGIGELGLLLGISQEESQKFWTERHDVKLSAKFNRVRSGHPQMPKYQRWVNALFEELQEAFDTSKHIQRGKEWYMFSKLSLIKA